MYIYIYIYTPMCVYIYIYIYVYVFDCIVSLASEYGQSPYYDSGFQMV